MLGQGIFKNLGRGVILKVSRINRVAIDLKKFKGFKRVVKDCFQKFSFRGKILFNNFAR